MSDAAANETPLPAGRSRRAGDDAVPAFPGRDRRSLDVATVLGLAGALALITGAITIGGSLAGFVDVPALLIVFVGTFAVTSVSFDLRDILRSRHVLLKSVFAVSADPHQAALATLKLAERCRQKGVLSIQSALENAPGDSFFARGLRLIVDGAPAGETETVMRAELHAIADRHGKGANILRRAAEVAPAMGLIGTLVGLVQMLGNLEDPAAIGPAMAVALLTTFYGAVLGNMVFTPLAGKLERRSDDEALLNEIYLQAVLSIARQEHPRRLEVMLNTILPPARRLAHFT